MFLSSDFMLDFTVAVENRLLTILNATDLKPMYINRVFSACEDTSISIPPRGGTYLPRQKN